MRRPGYEAGVHIIQRVTESGQGVQDRQTPERQNLRSQPCWEVLGSGLHQCGLSFFIRSMGWGREEAKQQRPFHL